MKTYLMAGTQIWVRKVGDTGAFVPHTAKSAVAIPDPARVELVNGTDWKFQSMGWEVVAPSAAVVRQTTRKDRAASGECERCRGRGHIAMYSHVQGGVCFKCGGTGSPLIKPAG